MSGKKTFELDVAILGGGFAGVYCAQRLVKTLGPESATRIGLISEENYMVFQPMLPEVAGASISPRHVVNPLRLLCKGARVFKARVDRVDWKNRQVSLDAGAFSGNVEVRFKHLALALGAVVDLSRIPGMPEHAFLMQNVGDAMHLRSTIISRIEEANLETRENVRKRLLTFVVVGGGYSGAETAGHILDLFRTIHEYYPGIEEKDLCVCLVHSRDHLLPTLSSNLGKYCGEKLEQRGLRLILNQRVKAVTANRVYLSDGSSIETNTVISTVGNAPHPLIHRLCKDFDLPCSKGQLATNSLLQVGTGGHLWAAGDCAAVPFIRGGLCPATAQFAMRQGTAMGENIARSLQQRPLEEFTFEGLGEMASIGRRHAVAEIKGFQFSGFFAWWLWRTVYLMKLPRFDRKLRVVIDWTLDLFFPRDINMLSPRFSTLLKEVYLEKGDILVQHDEPAFSFYIVKSGCIEIADHKGIVRIVGPGEYFGERALLDDEMWHFDAVAREPTALVSIPAKIFHQMVQGSGSLGRLFQKSAARYQSREIVEAITDRISAKIGKRKASDIMRTDLQTLRRTMTIREALQTTKARPHSSYPVTDDQGKLISVLHREDFYEFIKSASAAPDSTLEQVTLNELPTTPADASIDQIIERLIRSGSNKLLVVDKEQKLLGIITVLDLITAEETSAASPAA